MCTMWCTIETTDDKHRTKNGYVFCKIQSVVSFSKFFCFFFGFGFAFLFMFVLARVMLAIQENQVMEDLLGDQWKQQQQQQ